ncbi:DUF7573 domain-containing protein [Natronobacterium gregoryi]|uniref:DUF7573 domain-containing protein n=1 Tax=Natronobacterium gregoryi (strain ATCC 43098 / DSM 3393 / CCM 3738 / CIP 104747 / IAM 13177 / JCM 8860 / NBRC 102187 / NCIMB 2189 / SP2) TaxID=797304 RepID=A0A2J4JF33_NATGS|nr:hypothetical protein [Natronobacterium gregoryi]PLK20523.1 hypothetical protein CYV19_09280 [Natronobacterium gregoryi SP2]
MTDDAMLSTFTTADDGDDESSGTADLEAGDGEDGCTAVQSTYAWGDHECRRCGDDSDRVWRDGDAFVCPDCKEW